MFDSPLARRFVPRDQPVERIVRCMVGLILFGVGITLLIASDLGAAPWDVFHTGVSELTGISTGNVIIIVGVLLLLLWIPLREQPGLGTILNAFVIGIVVDITLPLVDGVDFVVVRVVMILGGVVIVAIGSGFYIGAGLGPGPRDGLMTGLARQSIAGHSISIRAARTGVEVIVLLIGIALGGAMGIGTVVFALAIGPLAQIFIPPLSMSDPVETTAPVPR
ncbi:membrane protein YczE [Ilumatobacter nonamiensis]|uniref:membrane protein YczE n=1 Tax=Ilumatobacter nonamiensis TaxID=467093 RepID=UPI00034C1689|nr:membrane protein [Ilumatobacter nonamiensis]